MTDLSSRIASALESPSGDARALEGLIREAQAALTDQDRQVVALQKRLLSPTTLEAEIATLHTASEAAAIKARRSTNALDQLRALHEEALRHQREAERAEHRRQVLAERDAVARDFERGYTHHAEALAALLSRVAESEAACAKINAPGPEAVARGIKSHNIHWLVSGVILPPWGVNDHKLGRGFWPPHRPHRPVVPSAMAESSARLGAEIRAIGAEVTAQRGKAVVSVAPAVPTSAAQEVA